MNLDTNDLLKIFENLGENREFGIVQRECGVNDPGLLRFVSAPLPVLITALEARFKGLGDPTQVEVLIDRSQEYRIYDRCFGFVFRPGLRVSDEIQEILYQQQVRQINILKNQLINDLVACRKIFVYRGMRRLPQALIERLLAALHLYGPNRLLWVDISDKDHPPGSVVLLDDLFYKGYLDQFMSDDSTDIPKIDTWITLCKNAHSLDSLE